MPEGQGGPPGEQEGTVWEDPVLGTEVPLDLPPVEPTEPSPELFADSGIDIASLEGESAEIAKRLQAHWTRKTQEQSAVTRTYTDALDKLTPLMQEAMNGQPAVAPAPAGPPAEGLETSEPTFLDEEGNIDHAGMESYIQARVDRTLATQVQPHVDRLNNLELQTQVSEWKGLLRGFPGLSKVWQSKEFLTGAKTFAQRNPNATVQDIFNAVAQPHITRAYQRHLQGGARRTAAAGITPGGPSIGRESQKQTGKMNFADHLLAVSEEAEQ